MEPAVVTSPHVYRQADASIPTSHVDIPRRREERDEGESHEDVWSGQESVNEAGAGRKGSQSSDRPLKRKRPVMVSCELCKQRKVKCDRTQPSCGWCTRNGQVCEYRERKKPGLRAGYGRELEQRLDRLEDVIQSQARLIESHIIQAQPRAGHEIPHQTSQSYSSPSERSAAHGSSPRDALYRQGSTSSLPTSHRGPHTIGSYNQEHSISTPSDTVFKNGMQHQFQNGISTHPLTSQSVETSRNDYAYNDTSSLKLSNQIYSSNQTGHQSLADSDTDLPPYDLLYALVDLYFEHINTWCPILHRRTTLDTLFGPSPLQEEDRMLLYAIVATTLRFSTDARLTEENRKQYHDLSKQKVLLYGLDNSSVTALQALVILALDLVGSSNGPPGWKLLALIARSVVQLGLAVESTSSLVATMFPSIYTLRANILPESKTWTEDEGRRRLFWMVYLLDRYSTIATAFDFALEEKEIDRKLPCKDEHFIKNQPVETRWFEAQEPSDYVTRRENMGSFGFYMEVLGILSRIHLFLKRPVDISAMADVEEWQATYRKLDNELTAWEYHLPKEYSFSRSSRSFTTSKSNRSVHCGWIMLHATYQTAVIRLHSSAAYPTTRSPIFTPSYSAIQRCLAAVDKIRLITRFVVDHNVLDKFGPPFAFTLWVSARLLLVNGSTVAHTLDPDINFFVDTLRRMGYYWKVAERYSTILQRVLDEYAEYEQSVGSGAGDRTTPSTVKILSDMRRCAFDLDFLISRQPPRNGMAPALPAADTPGTNSPHPPRNLGANELEYLDVFGFFNVPRLPMVGNGGGGVVGTETPQATAAPSQLDSMGVAQHQHQHQHQHQQHHPPHHPASQDNNNPNDTVGQISASDLTDARPDAADAAAAAAAGQTANEFNITNFMIPTPETDWLFRNAS